MSSFAQATRARARQTTFPTQEAVSGNSVDITNTVSTTVNNTVSTTFSGTVSVTGTFFPGTQTVSGTVSAQFFAASTGGYTPSTSTALSTAAFTVTTAQATLGGWFVGNPNTGSFAYVQLFDASTVTVGTTAPTMVLSIPAGGAANLQPFIAFGTAIKAAASTTPTGSASLSSALVASFWYK